MEVLANFAQANNASNYTVGVVVPTYSEAKRFTKDMSELLDEIPKWLAKPVIRVNTREIEFKHNFRITMLYSPNCSRGRSLSTVYASSRMTDDELTPHCFTVLHSGGTLNRFEDDATE